MKKVLLIPLVAGGLMFAGAPHSDAGVSVGIGFGFIIINSESTSIYQTQWAGLTSTSRQLKHGTRCKKNQENVKRPIYFPDFGEAGGFATGLLPG